MYIQKALAESESFCNSVVENNIKQNRTGNFEITVLHNGKPLDNTQVSYKLKKHDFDFGCNTFMLYQLQNDEDEKTYRRLWLNLFNTGVIPLYWEGTEPQQGDLRYSGECENNVYRRPPVDKVVDFCTENGVAMKGHPLFWHEFIPEWIPENWDSLLPLIEKRFAEISERYADKIPVFDLVNEPARLWDLWYETRNSGHKCVFPPDDYLDTIFALGKKYFPNNQLILNEAVSGSFCDFRGIYGGYYQLLEKCFEKGFKLDRIGLQCHVYDSEMFKNIFNAERLYGVLDIYGRFGKPLVLSEIGLSCDDEELQARAAEQLYKVCFSHKSMGGIFWWNLDDNGVLCTPNRNALGENLPTSGITRNGEPKAAYKALKRLIKDEWHTCGTSSVHNGKCCINGFYGTYEVTIESEGLYHNAEIAFLNNSKTAVINL